MDTIWYIVKVMPGKERSLTEDFNKQILQEKIKNIIRFTSDIDIINQLVIKVNKLFVKRRV